MIHELMASNTRAFPDVVDFEDYPDWIELKNNGGAIANLNGYFLSDDPTNPYKWPFPATASIAPGAYLLVMADGHDAVPLQSFPRGYWPWRNFTTERYHTNFNLASEGETLTLTQATGLSTTTLVNSAVPLQLPNIAATWKYLDNGSDQSTQWRARVFDDSLWAAGKSELGFGDNPQTTVFSPASPNRYITTYFRHSFNVANPAVYHGLTLNLLVDDGAVIYLNGAEIVRRNMPIGSINYKTLATVAVGGSDESTFFSYNVPASLLIAGDNVLAVEVHQAAATSSDLSFDMSLIASSHTSATAIDTISYTQQISDVSYGRDAVTPSLWKHFAESTPGSENATATVSDVRIAGNDVTASLAGGIYATNQTCTLTAPSGQIRYTLDGSNPKSTSLLYSAPLSITATTILRAACFESGKPPGQIITRSYFRGEAQGALPYVSVVADPNTLFGNTIGIYTNTHEPTSTAFGLSDVYKGKDAPGHIEFFAPGGVGKFNANVGIRIGGENNWVHPQKALNLAVRGKYGSEEVKYDIFPGSKNALHTGMTLRDGGDRWANEMLRDAIWSRIAKGYLNVDTADFRPVVVFINGNYYGLHDLRERWDDMWFAQKYHINSDDIDHLLYGHITSGDVTLGVDKGDSDDWLEFMNFINTADLTLQANWDFVESKIDVESFMDFVISESYGNNTSWFHNREFWKQKKAGARWKWFLTDMDRTLSTGTTTGILADMLANEDVLVRLKVNTTFKRRMAQRYAAHMASTFAEARMQALWTQVDAEISATEVSRHETRWAPGGMTTATRTAGIAGSKTYATTRVGNAHSEIATQLGMSTAVNFTLQMTGSGTVQVQGVPVAASTFKMFPNAPFTLKAIPAPGYAFSGWTGVTGGESTSLTITGASTVEAIFVTSNETLLSGTLPSDTTLSLGSSPYVITEDLIVPSGVTLTVPAGVVIRMNTERNIRVMGSLQVNGTASQKVQIIGRNGALWGGISFENPSAPSALAHAKISGATRGADATKYPSAISGLNANLTLDFMDITENEGPVFTRGGSMTLRDSVLYNPHTGDCINVKQGQAVTQRCTFLGNNAPDTDAIDYDGVANGLIEDCKIYRFQGSNSDGIDVGEGCTNLLVQGNLIYFNSDKGFSVGQASTVTLRKNLVVGCALGVGIKDTGSVATIDQNTFADCDTGVAVYEKNFGDGGGEAIITNTIISKSSTPPVTVDSFSTATASYSLSDTLPIAGTNNIVADPQFVDPVILNFSLKSTSPAINSGDPAHVLDADSSIVDRGAQYVYALGNYPYTIGETVVINEILANSGTANDWIELHNRTNADMNIGGWFLSDDGTNLSKYRIPVASIIPAGGYLVFYENANFGSSSIDTNKIVPFALSDVGETVYLSSAVNDEITDYQTKEDFGPSSEGETLGVYYKPSSGSYNFVAMNTPTPVAMNSGPRVGPIVISEIMYNPAGNGDAEYIELLNVSSAPVTLYDSVKGKAWRLSDGISFEFPSAVPLTMQAGERVILTKNISRFTTSFGSLLPVGTKVFEWITGGLDNGGETLQIDKPGPVDGLNVLQYVRQDRVNFDDVFPWPTSPDGTGPSLTKLSENDYGNDFINWFAATASPGRMAPGNRFTNWASSQGVSGTTGDPDGDGISNLLEYALGLDPMQASVVNAPVLSFSAGQTSVSFAVDPLISDLDYFVEASSNLQQWFKVDAPATSMISGKQMRTYSESKIGKPNRYFRLVVKTKP